MTDAKTIAQLLSSESKEDISKAVAIIDAGGLVAIPTETVYGLAGNALDNQAVANIFKAKGRPNFNPLICHVSSSEMAEEYVYLPDLAKIICDKFWPGPLSLVLKSKPDNGIAKAVSAGLGTLAVRCPAHTSTRAIIQQLAKPIAAPSANLSGKLSPTTAEDVIDGLGDRIDAVLDGGACPVGIESTIIAVEEDEITLLRPGTITADEISDAVGKPVLDRQGQEITAPGQLTSHYAPNAQIRLNITIPTDHEIMIGFNDINGDFNLSHEGNLREAAANLFHIMRKADALSKGHIAVAPIPNTGIGIAINDRLKRAAAPRPDNTDEAL